MRIDYKPKPNRALRRVGIRATTYHNQKGFLIYSGRGQGGLFGISIFVEDREKAQKIKKAYKTDGWTDEQISDLIMGRT